MYGTTTPELPQALLLEIASHADARALSAMGIVKRMPPSHIAASMLREWGMRGAMERCLRGGTQLALVVFDHLTAVPGLSSVLMLCLLETFAIEGDLVAVDVLMGHIDLESVDHVWIKRILPRMGIRLEALDRIDCRMGGRLFEKVATVSYKYSPGFRDLHLLLAAHDRVPADRDWSGLLDELISSSERGKPGYRLCFDLVKRLISMGCLPTDDSLSICTDDIEMAKVLVEAGARPRPDLFADDDEPSGEAVEFLAGFI